MKCFRWISLIVGILLVIFSFTLLSSPASGLVAAAVLLGVVFLFHGVGELSIYFNLPHDERSGWLLMGGLISIIFGVWTLTAQGTVSLAVALPFIVAMWIIFFGVIRVVASITLREINSHLATLNLILGVIGLILGFILLHHPAIGEIVVYSIVFAIFFCQGIGSIANFFLLKNK